MPAVEIARGIEEVPPGFGPSVATVGFFDGVHLGHRQVIGRTVEAARERGLPSAVVTFDRHPREVLTPGSAPRLLTTTQRKARLIEAVGADLLLVLPFTEELSRWPPERFVERVLVGALRAAHVVVGENFRFGHRAAGTLRTLEALGPSHGFTAEGVGLVELDGRRVSSTSIREALAAGDLAWPARALGRRFAVDGTVVRGAGRGRALGYPTANLATDPRLLLPARGIYAGVAEAEGGRWIAAISVGTNPTFGEEPLHAEAHLLDYEGPDLVGRPLALEFWARLRDEERFASPEDLSRAIARDVERTREIVSGAEAVGARAGSDPEDAGA
ncbi:MAG TPA: bifunctional riboflavin kinase/FAD synthetase [Actinomycetota bacterium]|nr:bifunctional riboflavin kinase/FAD synthetase [Actinomycetota bacterium]